MKLGLRLPIGLSLFVAGLVSGLMLSELSAQTRPSQDDNYAQLSLFAEALHTIRLHHIDPPGVPELIEAAIVGMTNALDAHSEYLSPRQRRMLHEDSSGNYYGIGVSLELEARGGRVTRLFEHGPAARAGIRVGDLLLEVDTLSLSDSKAMEVLGKLRESSDNELRLLLEREGEQFETFVRREAIHIEALHQRMLPGGVLWVQLHQFHRDTTDALASALFAGEGLAPSALILDLRNNTGGLLSEAIDVSELFLRRGTIVEIDAHNGRALRRIEAEDRGRQFDAPMIVLTNEYSASASEIVAAALRDNGRARIVGTQSYGKASIQSIFALGNEGAFKLSVGEYYSPSGHCIHGHGLTPDIAVGEEDPSVGDVFSKGSSWLCAARDGVDQRTAIFRTAGKRALRMAEGDPTLGVALELLWELVDNP